MAKAKWRTETNKNLANFCSQVREDLEARIGALQLGNEGSLEINCTISKIFFHIKEFRVHRSSYPGEYLSYALILSRNHSWYRRTYTVIWRGHSTPKLESIIDWVELVDGRSTRSKAERELNNAKLRLKFLLKLRQDLKAAALIQCFPFSWPFNSYNSRSGKAFGTTCII